MEGNKNYDNVEFILESECKSEEKVRHIKGILKHTENHIEEEEDNEEIVKSRYRDEATILLLRAEKKQIITSKVQEKTSLNFLNEQNKERLVKIEKISNKIKDRIAENEELTKNVTVAKYEITQSSHQMSYTGEMIIEFKNGFEKIEKNLNDITSRAVKLSKNVTNLTELKQIHTDNTTKIVELRNSLKKRSNVTEQRDDSLLRENSRLKQLIEEASCELDAVNLKRKTLETFQIQNYELFKKTNENEREINDLNKIINEVETDKNKRICIFQNQEESLKRNISLFRKKNDEILEKIKNVDDEINYKQKEIKKIEEKNLKLEENLREVEKKLDVVKNCLETVKIEVNNCVEEEAGKFKIVENDLIVIEEKNRQSKSTLKKLKQKHQSAWDLKNDCHIARLASEKEVLQKELLLSQQTFQNEQIAKQIDELKKELFEIISRETTVEEKLTSMAKLPSLLAEDRVKMIEDHKSSMVQLKKDEDYAEACLEFAENKAKIVEKTRDDCKKSLSSLKQDLHWQKLIVDSERKNLTNSTKKLEEEKAAYEKLCKSNVPRSDSPAGILKSPKTVAKCPKTPPKKVKFEGFSSLDSGSGESAGVEKEMLEGLGAKQPGDKRKISIDEIIKEIEQEQNSNAGTPKTPKRRNLNFDFD